MQWIISTIKMSCDLKILCEWKMETTGPNLRDGWFLIIKVSDNLLMILGNVKQMWKTKFYMIKFCRPKADIPIINSEEKIWIKCNSLYPYNSSVSNYLFIV